MADTIILDPYGQPVSSASYNYNTLGGGAGRFIEGASNGGGERPYWPTRLDSINRLLPAYEWRVLVAICEKLVANFDLVKGAIWSKANYTVGRAWEPRFLGEATTWGNVVVRWLVEQYYPMCDVRGPMHDFQTLLQLDSVAIERGGDFGVLLTEYDDGFPAEQRVPNWRIGATGGGAYGAIDAVTTNKKPDGTYINDAHEAVELKLNVPLSINNGVISNAIGRPLYYRIRTDQGNAETAFNSPDYTDVHASDFQHVYDPEYYEQGRGLPSFSASVNPLRDALTSRDWEMVSMMAHSSIVFTEDNETGGAPAGSDALALARMANAGPPSDGLQSQSLYGGVVRYFKANSGSKLSSFSSNRPGDSWDALQDRIAHSAIRGMGWSPMLAIGTANPGGQLARADLDQCRASVCDRQDLLRMVARRRIGRAVSKAIKIGAVPPYPGKDLGGFLKWGFSMPGEISIDANNDRKNDRADLLAGVRNHRRIVAANGDGEMWNFVVERAADTGMRKRAAAEENRKPENIALGVVIDDRDMMAFSPNEQPDSEVGRGDDVANPADPNPPKP